MSYPQQVPPGWERGCPVVVVGAGPKYAVGRRIQIPTSAPVTSDDAMILFDSYDDVMAWLKWWRQ